MDTIRFARTASMAGVFLAGLGAAPACDSHHGHLEQAEQAARLPSGPPPLSGNDGNLFGDIDFTEIERAKERAAHAEAEEATRRGVPVDSDLAWKGYNRSDNPIVTRHQAMMAIDPNNHVLFAREHHDAFGNNRFGAGYAIKVHASAQRTDFTANTQLRGYANTWARVWSPEFTRGIFTVDAVANTINNPSSQWAGIWYKVMVFENTIKEATIGAGAFHTEKALVDRTQRVTPELKSQFTVFGVPVTVSAYVRANEYVKLRGKIWLDEVNASLTPGGSMWVNAYAAAGIEGVVRGIVRGMLQLVEVSAPFTANAGWNVGADQGGQCHLGLGASANVDWISRELAGNIAVCGELVGWEKCMSVASWNGFRQQRNLFNETGWRQFGLGTCLPPPPAPVKS